MYTLDENAMIIVFLKTDNNSSTRIQAELGFKCIFYIAITVNILCNGL